MSDLTADPRMLRQAADHALGRLSEPDWRRVAGDAARLVELINQRNPRVAFDISDALELLARLGMFLAGEPKK